MPIPKTKEMPISLPEAQALFKEIHQGTAFGKYKGEMPNEMKFSSDKLQKLAVIEGFLGSGYPQTAAAKAYELGFTKTELIVGLKDAIIAHSNEGIGIQGLALTAVQRDPSASTGAPDKQVREFG